MPDLYTFLMPFNSRVRVYIWDDTGYLLISGVLENINYEKYDLCPVKEAEISVTGNLTVYIEVPNERRYYETND